MTPVALLLIAKIALTLPGVALPLLLGPTRLMDRLSGWSAPPLLYRLYGAAVLALVTAYAFGIADALTGVHPTGMLWIGLVSNGAATLVLALHRPGGPIGAAAVPFGLIAAGFAAAILFPGAAMTPF